MKPWPRGVGGSTKNTSRNETPIQHSCPTEAASFSMTTGLRQLPLSTAGRPSEEGVEALTRAHMERKSLIQPQNAKANPIAGGFRFQSLLTNSGRTTSTKAMRPPNCQTRRPPRALGDPIQSRRCRIPSPRKHRTANSLSRLCLEM
jgi:hypothetical protein